MKTNHNNLKLIKKWLDMNASSISFDDAFIRAIYHEAIMPHHKIAYKISGSNTEQKSRIRGFELQYDFVRRDLLKLKYMEYGSASQIREGFVYLITNPAWDEHAKIGSAIDVVDRLNSYQTSSPLRDYKLISYYFNENRYFEERKVRSAFGNCYNEWVQGDILYLATEFNKRKEMSRIRITDDIRLRYL